MQNVGRTPTICSLQPRWMRGARTETPLKYLSVGIFHSGRCIVWIFRLIETFNHEILISYLPVELPQTHTYTHTQTARIMRNTSKVSNHKECYSNISISSHSVMSCAAKNNAVKSSLCWIEATPKEKRKFVWKTNRTKDESEWKRRKWWQKKETKTDNNEGCRSSA